MSNKQKNASPEWPRWVQWMTASRVWRSFFRHGWPTDRRNRSLVMTENVFFHLHSVKVSRKSLDPIYSMGLGIMSLVLFLILGVTGVFEMFFYVPSVETAYNDIIAMQTDVAFGQLLRNIHRWAAHGMVIVVTLHMVRVFFTGAYKPPREFNWIMGVLLLLFTLLASFTGYLLPWDQLAFWAITVGTNIAGEAPVIGEAMREMLLGGTEVGQPALIRFYTLHIAVIPLVMLLILTIHLWRVRKDGGMAAIDEEKSKKLAAADAKRKGLPAPAADETDFTPASDAKTFGLVAMMRGRSIQADADSGERIFTFPIVLMIELVIGLGTTLLMLFFAMIRDAPLEELANPLVTTNPAKAPWYFMGLQELLEHMHPMMAGILLPGALVTFLIVLPYIDSDKKGSGLWFTSLRGWQITWTSTLYALIVMPLYIVMDDVYNFQEIFSDISPISSTFFVQAIIPGVFLTFIAFVPALVLVGKHLLDRANPEPITMRDVMLAVFTVMLVAAIVFTVVGFLFRGPNFELYWPWNFPDGYNPLDAL
jgi:quinol-cytochrome oxidoreductase complex cytochrome b subunit